MTNQTILVVDDEPEISLLLEKYLSREGYKVITAQNGSLAIQKAREYHPDLIILDILLPDLDGIQVCLKIRSTTTAPILFLSCKDEDSDKILGLGVGADDYITKPFSPSEIVARVKAHLRRAQLYPESKHYHEPKIQINAMLIDPSSYTVMIDTKKIDVTAKEFELLHFLAKHPNQVFSSAQLFNRIWGEDSLGDTRTVLVHISNLRRKIEVDPNQPQLIITVRGVGYKLQNI